MWIICIVESCLCANKRCLRRACLAYMGSPGGPGVSVATSQLQGSWFVQELWLLPVCVSVHILRVSVWISTLNCLHVRMCVCMAKAPDPP